MEKYCKTCDSIKDTSLFYNSLSKKDKKSSNCKECDDKAKALWRLNNIEKARNYDRNRVYKNNGKKIAQNKKRSRLDRKTMSDSYMRELITKKSNLKPEDLSNEFIEAYRVNLKLKRALKLTPKLKGGEGKP